MTVVPPRAGPRPRTDRRAPHTQLDQLAPPADRRALSHRLLGLLADLAGVVQGGSNRAPPGTVGLHLTPDRAGGDARAFLLGTEFAHVHVADDASLHAILPEPLRCVPAGGSRIRSRAGRPSRPTR